MKEEDILHLCTYSNSTGFVQENGFWNLRLLGEVRLVIVIGKYWPARDHENPQDLVPSLKENLERGRSSSHKIGLMIFFLFCQH